MFALVQSSRRLACWMQLLGTLTIFSVVFQLVLDSPLVFRECFQDRSQSVDKEEQTAELICGTLLVAEQQNDMFEVALVGELLRLYFLSLSRPFYLVHWSQTLDVQRVRHSHFGRIGRHETAVAFCHALLLTFSRHFVMSNRVTGSRAILITPYQEVNFDWLAELSASR